MSVAGSVRDGASPAERWAALALAAGALVFRLLFLGSRLVLEGDELHYAESLHRFLHGRFLEGVSDYWSFFYPFAGVPFALAAGSVETGLRLLSIAAGALAVLPAMSLARRIAGPRESLLAGALVAVHPILISFSTTAATEPLFSILLLVSLLLLARALERGRTMLFAVSGGALGLAYLTRPEGQFFLPVFVVAALVSRAGRGGAPSRAIRAAAVTAAFAAVSIPYFILLREATGSWTAGSKASVNLSSPVIWEDTLERERFVYSLDESGTERLIETAGRESALAVLWREKGRIAARYLPRMKAGFGLVPLLLTSPALIVLLPLGCFARRARPGGAAARRLLFAAGAFPFAFYSIFRVELRYLVPYLPVYLIWAGIGCGVLIDWIGEFSGRRRWIPRTAAALVFASLVPFSFSKYILTKRTQRTEWREVGAWLGGNAAGARILAHSGCPASYYAGEPEATFLPWTDAPGLLRFARHHGFRYVVIDEEYVRAFRPTLGAFVGGAPPEFEEARTFAGASGGRIVVYRLSGER